MPSFKIYQDRETGGRFRKGFIGKKREETRQPLKDVNRNCCYTDLKKAEKKVKENEGEVVEKMEVDPPSEVRAKKDSLVLAGCPWYKEEIYKYLKSIEMKYWPKRNFMSKQPYLTAVMRSMIVDWLVDVSSELEIEDEVLFVAVGYIDRFLCRYSVTEKKLQLLGVAALYLAAKYEAVYFPHLREFAFLTESSIEQFMAMEIILLKGLKYELVSANPLVFLQHFAYDAWLDKCAIYLASYILELTLVEGGEYFMFPPSLISSAAVALARYCLGARVWPERLSSTTGYFFPDLCPILHYLNTTHDSANTLPFRAVQSKYSSEKYCRVATIPHIDLDDKYPNSEDS